MLNIPFGHRLLSALRNTGVYAFQGFLIYINMYGTTESVRIIGGVHFSGMSTRQGFTLVAISAARGG